MDKPIILVAVDFFEGAEKVLQRARALADFHQSALHVVHVIEPLPDRIYANDPLEGVSLQEHVEQMLVGLCQSADVAVDEIHVQKGAITKQLLSCIDTLTPTCVVVGAHGRKGHRLFIGSSARGLVNAAPCDIMIVKRA